MICITFHELAHGYVAYRLGDHTARYQGRLTLNPIAHIDPIGLLCMIIAGFGWAKPVPVNPLNFNMSNKKLGMAITALAGPISNLLLALVGLIALNLTYLFGVGSFAYGFSVFMSTFVFLNIGLAVFNMIPIPPLDGSKVIMPLLPDKVIDLSQKYGGIISMIFLAAVVLDLFNDFIFSGVMFVFNYMDAAVYFLFKLLGAY